MADEIEARVAEEGAALYDDTGGSGQVIATVAGGTEVEVAARDPSGEWLQVSTPNLAGWVAARDLYVRGNVTALPVPGEDTPAAVAFPAGSIEEAERRLVEIEHEIDLLDLQKDAIMEKERQLRTAREEAHRQRSTAGDGIIGKAAPKIGDIQEDLADVTGAYTDREYSQQIEALEAERAAVEAQILALEKEAIDLEHAIEVWED
jgi:hypothetical protein